jgi:DNA-binding MarR family transcriptional regulator
MKESRGAYRASDPETSKQAAFDFNAKPLESQIVYALQRKGPMICREICDFLHLDWNTISPRLAPLRTKGWIEKTGVKRPPSGHGRVQEEYRIAGAQSAQESPERAA